MKVEAPTPDPEQLSLYSYWRSSAAYRVRIALNLKGLSYEQLPVHLVRQGGEQHSEAFRLLNPQGLVPVLLHAGHVLTQSMAICEYLDEQFDAYPLLPEDPAERANTRSMALQIACEIHPLNNLRVQKYLQNQHADAFNASSWMKHWLGEGFMAIEQRLAVRNNNCSDYYADIPGLFECFLVPQVYNAERFSIDLSAFPQICQITANCKALPAFLAAAPENQPDAVV